jgi:hypothetical protein
VDGLVTAGFAAGGRKMERRTNQSVYELLQRERYTPEELAEVLGIGLDVVRHAAFTGELKAQIIGHDIIGLCRVDVLDWLAVRDGRERTA